VVAKTLNVDEKRGVRIARKDCALREMEIAFRAMGLRPASRQLVLAVLVAVALVCEVWYLRPAGATWLIVSCVFVGLVMAAPLFIFHGRTSGEMQRIAVVWIVGGVLGAYLVGIFVLAAGVVALFSSAFKSGAGDQETPATVLGRE
jgi:hypothetical protein